MKLQLLLLLALCFASGIALPKDNDPDAVVPEVTLTESETTLYCDASVAPENGGVGDCTAELASGSTCQPTCNEGYTVSGKTSCMATSLGSSTHTIEAGDADYDQTQQTVTSTLTAATCEAAPTPAPTPAPTEAPTEACTVETSTQLSGTATQSSVYYSSGTQIYGYAAHAIDGNTDQQWSGGSCSMTQSSDDGWWKMTFDGSKAIQNVEVWNRADWSCGNIQCSSHLAGAEVFAGETKCGDLSDSADMQTVNCGGASADYLTIKQGASQSYLMFCEVKVYGC